MDDVLLSLGAIPVRNLTVVRDDSDDLRRSVRKEHYLKRWPSPLALPFGYRLLVDRRYHAPDMRPWGFVVMTIPQHRSQKGLFGHPDLPTAWQVLNLARVWVHPVLQDDPMETHHEEVPYCENRHGQLVPKRLNVFSRMVGMVLRRVQWDWLAWHPPIFPQLPYHITLIISYCEIAHHDGTAYRACSFTLQGLSSDGTKELYVRRLRMPQKSWKPQAQQLPLFEEMPETVEAIR